MVFKEIFKSPDFSYQQKYQQQDAALNVQEVNKEAGFESEQSFVDQQDTEG
jgi:hypothetical protein